MIREETTTFVEGVCSTCGERSHTQYDGGIYCDGCKARVTAGAETLTLCPCGRNACYLNAASDTPKCAGCGLVGSACRCESAR